MSHLGFLLLVTLASVAEGAVVRNGGEALLDFEQESERAAVPFRNAGGVSVMVTNRLAVSGNYAVRFAVPPFRKGGMAGVHACLSQKGLARL